MDSLPILSLVTFLPLLGAFVIALIGGSDQEALARNAKATALWVSGGVFFLSLLIWYQFDPSTADFQMVEFTPWMDDFGISYRMGVDGISLFFVILSTFLTPICILASWDSIKTHVREYMVAFLVLETLMVGMFCALDIIVFYIFFEAVLIPMYIIIGVWGGARRIYASFKFFLYTLLGSILMLVAILVMYFHVGTTSIIALMQYPFDAGLQKWLWLAFFASFAVKVPMWPVHTWLPDAHVEAPTAGSVILAGVLLKMGGYGLLRFSLPMFPDASEFFAPLVFFLSIVAVIYTSMVALVQKDMKKLIAYSSIAHMGFVTAGIFAVNEQAVAGSIIQMLSHGIVSGALFLCVGVVYDRIHSRQIADYEGLANNMPSYGLFFMLFMMASVGLPGTSGFVGEFLILLGVFKYSTWVGFLLSTAMVLGAAYMLYLYRRIIFGALTFDNLMQITDLHWREKLIFISLSVIILWMGIYPMSFLDFINVSVDHLVQQYHTALNR